MEEEKAGRDKEVVYDARLIGPGGVVADGAVNVILKELPEGEKRVGCVCRKKMARELI